MEETLAVECTRCYERHPKIKACANCSGAFIYDHMFHHMFQFGYAYAILDGRDKQDKQIQIMHFHFQRQVSLDDAKHIHQVPLCDCRNKHIHQVPLCDYRKN